MTSLLLADSFAGEKKTTSQVYTCVCAAMSEELILHAAATQEINYHVFSFPLKHDLNINPLAGYSSSEILS